MAQDRRQIGMEILQSLAILIDSDSNQTVRLPDGTDLRAGLDMPEDAEWLRKRAAEMSGGLFTIVVAGDFNNGKSTLVNALTGREVLPMGATATTAVITRMSRGHSLEVKVIEQSGAERNMDLAAFASEFRLNRDYHPGADSSLRSEADEDPQFAEIRAIEITVPFTIFAPGVEIIDTPGLGEHERRTRLVLDYLPRAHAVIVVIDAQQPLKRDEREFIQLLGRPPFAHVFFVVNRIDFVRAEEQQAVRDYVKQRLRPYFLDARGRLDEALFQSRVFFTNSFQALETRISEQPDAMTYAASGVLDLERALLSFLDGVTREEASLQSAAQRLTDLRYRAEEDVRYRRAVLRQPLDVLQEKRQKLGGRLAQMRRAANHISDRIADMGKSTQHQVYANLLNYIEDLQRMWPHDVEQLDLSEVQNFNLLAVRLSQENKDRFVQVLSNELKRYLEIKLVQWAQRMSGVVGPRIDELTQDIRNDLALFNLELAQLVEAFAGSGSAGRAPLPVALSADARTDNMSQLMRTDAFSQDLVRSVTNVVLGGLKDMLKDRNMLLTIGYSALSSLLAVAGMIPGASVARGFLVLLGANFTNALRMRHEQKQMHRDLIEESRADRAYDDLGQDKVQDFQQAVREALVKDLQDRLFDHMRQQVIAHREGIHAQVAAEFRRMGENVRERLDQAIDRVVEKQESLIQLRRSKEQSVQSELERLERLLSLVARRYDDYCHLVYGHTLSDEEIVRVGESHAVFLETYGQIVEVVDLDQPAESAAEPAPEDDRENEHLPVDPAVFEETVARRIQAAIRVALNLPAEAETVVSREDAQLPSVKLARLVGLQSVKKRVLEFMDYQAESVRRRESGLAAGVPPSLHLVFTGNPGTGKTTVAEAIGEMYRHMGLLKSGHVRSVAAGDLIAGYVRQTAQQTRKVIESAMDGVLFIDEAYDLFSSGNGDFGQQAVAEIILAMERYRNRLVVIMAGYPKRMEAFLHSNPGLMGRFPEANTIDFPDYTPEELFRILEMALRDRAFTLSEAAGLAVREVIEGLYAARDEEFGNARAMRNLAESLIRRQAVRVTKQNLPVTEPIQPEDIDHHYQLYRRVEAGDQAIAAALGQLDAMIGLKPVKDTVRRLVARMKLSKEDGDRLEIDTLHFIFVGNPGTGKTTVAELFGKILSALGYLRRGDVKSVTAGDLIAGYVRQTAEKTRNVIESAMDGVLFIDEAYDLFSSGQGDFGQQAIAELLRMMESHRDRLVVILAGYPREMQQLLDSNSGLRSRFRQQLEFPDYSPEELMEIFEYLVKQKRPSLTLTPAARARVDLYLERVRKQSRRKFGNARAARLLLDEMIDHYAYRVINAPDEADKKGRRGVLEAEDVPEIQEIYITPADEDQNRRCTGPETGGAAAAITDPVLDADEVAFDFKIVPPAADWIR